MGNNHKLFEEFPPISTEKWEELVLKDLKGQDYEKKLCWTTLDGFMLEPYYRSEDLSSLNDIDIQPGSFPFTRGNSPQKKWEIHQRITDTNPEKANLIALNAIKGGVNYVCFNASEIKSLQQLSTLLSSIDLHEISVGFFKQECNRYLRNLLTEFAVNNDFDKTKIRGNFEADPYGSILSLGDYPDNPDTIKRRLYELIDTLDTHMPNFRGITIKGQDFHNAGATASQELAYVLSLGVEYLSMLTEQELPIQKITPFMQLSFGIGGDYFIELAKIRAARMLWSRIIELYAPKSDETCKVFIHGETSNFNKSMYDSHTNMLRSTTEAMSAIIGGVDSLEVRPFDQLTNNPNEFSSRIARNVQLLLKEESYLDKVADPSSGSYYVETITHKLAQTAWELFQSIEKEGGFLVSIEKGIIQNQIKQTVKKREELVSKKKEPVLGASLYPNSSEKILESIEVEAINTKIEDSRIERISPIRKALPFEKLRLKTEKHVLAGNKLPIVFILPIGNPAMASARQIFSRNFFGCAGFEIIENARFSKIENGIEAAYKQKADLIVICSSDDEYLQYCKQISGSLSKSVSNSKLIIAGYPKEGIEELNNNGVFDFIHLKTNHLESLSKYQQLFDIID